MDSWPAWVRWVALLPAVILVSILKIVALALVSSPSIVVVIWLLTSTLFVWSGVAVAPRLKWVVALILALPLIYVAKTFLDESARRAVVVPASAYHDYVLVLVEWAVAILAGTVIAWGLIVWGYLRRRQVSMVSR
jgi:hypothetical protein